MSLVGKTILDLSARVSGVRAVLRSLDEKSVNKATEDAASIWLDMTDPQGSFNSMAPGDEKEAEVLWRAMTHLSAISVAALLLQSRKKSP